MATINKIDEIKIDDKGITYDIGYKKIDDALKGLKEGSIITIGGLSGIGTSSFINNIIFNLLEKYNLPTLLVSLESNKEFVEFEFITILLEKDSYEVYKDENLRKVGKDKIASKNYNFYISDNCNCINELEQLIGLNKDIKFLVIDPIQLMKSEKNFNSRIDNFNDVLDRLRALANKYKLIIFLLSQISGKFVYRGDSRPKLEDLRGGSNLGYISDIVLFLNQNILFDKPKPVCESIEVFIAKNRYGSSNLVYYLDFDNQKLKYNEFH